MMPGVPVYDMASPVFTKGDDPPEKWQRFVIAAPDSSATNKYVQSVPLERQDTGSVWIDTRTWRTGHAGTDDGRRAEHVAGLARKILAAGFNDGRSIALRVAVAYRDRMDHMTLAQGARRQRYALRAIEVEREGNTRPIVTDQALLVDGGIALGQTLPLFASKEIDEVLSVDCPRDCDLIVQPRSKTLDIYFIDVEGGQATLFVTPQHESLLIDTGWAGTTRAMRSASWQLQSSLA